MQHPTHAVPEKEWGQTSWPIPVLQVPSMLQNSFSSAASHRPVALAAHAVSQALVSEHHADRPAHSGLTTSTTKPPALPGITSMCEMLADILRLVGKTRPFLVRV